jgi:hypothetical protein
MQCRRDLILFSLERAKCLVQTYIKEFDWKCFSKVTKILEQKALGNSSATFLNLEKIFYN